MPPQMSIPALSLPPLPPSRTHVKEILLGIVGLGFLVLVVSVLWWLASSLFPSLLHPVEPVLPPPQEVVDKLSLPEGVTTVPAPGVPMQVLDVLKAGKAPAPLSGGSRSVSGGSGSSAPSVSGSGGVVKQSATSTLSGSDSSQNQVPAVPESVLLLLSK